MPPAPGSRLDTYELLAPLGSGGMGDVWLASDLRLERKVALKFLPAELTRDPARVSRFEREARAASALNHPNVCTILALGESADGQRYIAMEYVEGETLRKRLSTSRLTIREALDVAIQVASALAAAHAAGIVHRDIKPENVMLRPDGFVKVLDFGLAKLTSASDAQDVQPTRTAFHTEAGTVVGTIAYMSPEQARGEHVDARTDIWALGATLYEMLTGRAAFAAQSPALAYGAVLNGTPPPPSHSRPSIPVSLDAIVAKALEKDRELRFQTAAGLRTELLRLQRADEQEPPAATSRRRTPSAGGGRRWLRLAVLATAGIAVGLAALWMAGAVLQRRGEFRETQVTTNSSEMRVTAAAISRDGRYVAFGDAAGLHVKVIETGETHALNGPPGAVVDRIAWFADGSKILASARSTPGRPGPSLWAVSMIGGSPRKLRDDGSDGSVSPDASRLAFVGLDGDIWIAGPNGEEPRRVLVKGEDETLTLPSFAEDGTRIVYGRVRAAASPAAPRVVSAETRDESGHTTVLLTDPGLRGAAWLADGRLVYALDTGTPSSPAGSIWEARLGQRGAGAASRRRIEGPFGGHLISQFSSSADGRRIVFLKASSQRDVYVARMGRDGTPLDARRLTLDDSHDVAHHWTPDGTGLLFTSSRSGSFDIFRQALDARTADAVVDTSLDEIGPIALDREHGWLYYLARPRRLLAEVERPNVVMRIPLAGGPSQQVADGRRSDFVTCARGASAACVLVQQEGNALEVYELDQARGRGALLGRTTGADPGASYHTDLSPEGSRLAIVLGSGRSLRLLSMRGGPSQDVAISGYRLDAVTPCWAHDGSGVYVATRSTAGDRPGTDLLFVEPDGRAHPVWHQVVSDWTNAIPSPDGRHLALTLSAEVSNVWMIEEQSR